MRRIIVDTGPLWHLREAHSFDLLFHMGEMWIPSAVENEITNLDSRWHHDRPDWIRRSSLSPQYHNMALDWHQSGILDLGEAQAIALAIQLKGDWLLTDDALARLVAKSMGLEVHGSLGVILWAAAVGHLSQKDALNAIERLANSSLWISKRILDEAKSALERMVS